LTQTKPDEAQTSNFTNHNLNYIITFEQPKKKLS